MDVVIIVVRDWGEVHVYMHVRTRDKSRGQDTYAGCTPHSSASSTPPIDLHTSSMPSALRCNVLDCPLIHWVIADTVFGDSVYIIVSPSAREAEPQPT
jgi:hypothetical protein